MKKLLIVAGSIACSVSYAASPVFQPIGSSFTLGTSANVRALSTSLNNPAAPFLMVDTEAGDRFRFGIVGPGGFGYELGQLDSASDKLDELETILDKDDIGVSEITEVQSKANELIAVLGDDFNGKFMTAGQIPLMPVIFKHPQYGAFTFDASLSIVGQGKILDDEVKAVVNPLTQTFQLQTNTSLYVKTGVDMNFGFGYSKDAWANAYGLLVAGAKLNVHAITLGKSLLSLGGADDSAGDAFSDGFSDNITTTVAPSLDLGLIWTSDYYQVGATFANLNEPTFEYGQLGVNCSSLSGSSAQANCFSAREFAGNGDIALSETHTLERQVTLDSSVYLSNRQWTISGAYDLMAISDLVGDKYQWATVSASYFGDNWYLPGARFGYKKNLAGTELSYITGGLTVFKRVNLDFAYGLESIDVDGSSLPRSMYFSAGIESAF